MAISNLHEYYSMFFEAIKIHLCIIQIMHKCVLMGLISNLNQNLKVQIKYLIPIHIQTQFRTLSFKNATKNCYFHSLRWFTILTQIISHFLQR